MSQAFTGKKVRRYTSPRSGSGFLVSPHHPLNLKRQFYGEGGSCVCALDPLGLCSYWLGWTCMGMSMETMRVLGLRAEGLKLAS